LILIISGLDEQNELKKLGHTGKKVMLKLILFGAGTPGRAPL
jgi:hypothetical protein